MSTTTTDSNMTNEMISKFADYTFEKLQTPLTVIKIITLIAGLIMLAFGAYRKNPLMIFFGLLYVVPAIIPTKWAYDKFIDHVLKKE